jgi:pyruvate/2-oxoglutarate dehydrogenase complex dihydrolipoamide acyltransferase (E2) component
LICPTSRASEATIVKWWKKDGDSIKEKEVLLEVMTEKVNTEIESPVSGIVIEIVYPNDSVVRVGQVIARIEQEN